MKDIVTGIGDEEVITTMSAPIQKSPDVLGGDARIGNRRIAVWMLVRARQQGLSDAEIQLRYQPPLTTAEMAAAWSFYKLHREEIERALQDHEDA